MEPIDLTCAKCGKGWKLIKAGAGPVTCPHCKALLGSPDVQAHADGVSKEPTPVATVSKEPKPVATAAATPAPPAATLQPTPPATMPVHSAGPGADVDDPALAADFDDQFVQNRGPGKHPLVRVILILLLLFILVPLAVFVLFAIVCAILIAAR